MINLNFYTKQTGSMKISTLLLIVIALAVAYSTTNLFQQNSAESTENSNENKLAPSSTTSGKTARSKQSTPKSGVASMYPFSAMDKAKNCVNLSSQIADARNRGKDHSKLSAQYEKTCR